MKIHRHHKNIGKELSENHYVRKINDNDLIIIETLRPKDEVKINDILFFYREGILLSYDAVNIESLSPLIRQKLFKFLISS